MRLIDADALPEYTGYALSANEVAMAVEDAPAIDAVEVVRCQNCKYSYVDEKTVVCGLRGFFVRDGFFCADGERRIDEVD